MRRFAQAVANVLFSDAEPALLLPRTRHGRRSPPTPRWNETRSDGGAPRLPCERVSFYGKQFI